MIHDLHPHKLKDKANSVYIHLTIEKFATSMIAIFLPIFLLKVGFTLQSVFLFLLVQWTSFSLCVPICAYMISKIGIRESILSRTPFFIIGLIFLIAIEKNPFYADLYLLSAFLLGFSTAFHHLSIQALFAELVPKKKVDKGTSKFLSLPSLGTILGPSVGGLIAVSLGFPWLLIIVSIFLVSGVIPILIVKQKYNLPEFNFTKFKNLIKKNKKTFFFTNIYGVWGTIIWLILPIAVFITNQNIIELGVIFTIIYLLNIFFTLKLGNIEKKYGRSRILKIGAIIVPIFFILLAITFGSKLFIYLTLISGFASVWISLPYESFLFESSKKSKSPLTYLAFKEISFLFGRVLLLTLLIIFADNIESAFYLGALSSFIMWFL